MFNQLYSKVFWNILAILLLYSFMTNAQNSTDWQLPYDTDEYTIALWHFDETAGNNVADAGPNNYDGVSTNTNITISMNEFGNAREFLDDPIGYITFGNFNLPQFEGTLEYWINPNIRPVTSCDHSHFFVKGTHGNSGSGFTFYNRLYNDTDVDFGVGDSGGDTGRRFENVFNYNEWQHVALTWTTVETKMYVNGELISVMDPFPIGIGQSSDEVALGKWGSQLYTSCRYLGYIDELRISNIERTFEPPSALVAFYPFNGNANDESGNGNDGIVVEAQLTTDMCGNENSAYYFDGIDDEIILGSAAFNFVNHSYSISVWARWDKESNLGTHILDKQGYPVNGGGGYRLYTGTTTDGKIIFAVSTEVFGYGFVEYNTHVVPELYTWYHIVVSSDVAGNTTVYINGEAKVTALTEPLIGNPFDLKLGRRIDFNGSRFKGVIDEVRIYNYSLSEEEVLALIEECPLGIIAGTVSVNDLGLENVLVKLLDDSGLPVDGFDDIYTDANGEYSFTDVTEGDYQVMIVEPLGYVSDGNPKTTIVVANETSIVDFDLTEVVVLNNARSKGYWKHQFDVYVRNRGNAQESEQDLNDYIALVQQHYNLYYDIFTDVNTFTEWQEILSIKGNHPMADRAKQHLSALILNMVSNKIGQYTLVTDDEIDVGDVIQYVSEMIIDGDDTNDELAKDLAESVNNQQMIAAGIVPEGDILFKISSEAGKVLTYDLENNYPNPFNPSTVINYQIPVAGFVTLKVYDVLGNEVVALVNESKGKGSYSVLFGASAISSGVYIYQLRVNNYLSTKKMILMK